MVYRLKPLLITAFILTFFLGVCSSVWSAETDYVLPYPSYMPGNKLYVVKEVWDKFLGLFMFGNFTKFTFELHLADRKLVEAKTLYEYKQTALAKKALEQYRLHMQVLPVLLKNAQKEGKNISQKEKLLQSALKTHAVILRELSAISP